MTVSRFAPSTTGPAHLGTLTAALLCWLDARKRGLRLVLRLEDLDPERCKPQFSQLFIQDLAWFGLDFDEVMEQRKLRDQHEGAMDRLEQLGVLYPCSVTREQVRATGKRAPDGGWAYDNRARRRPLPKGGWRASTEPIRVRLPDEQVCLEDESGMDLSQTPSLAFGDPVVRRRDGSFSYHLAGVVDDGILGVTRVVRGKDLAPSAATHVAMQRLLELKTPVYRHHLLLLEERGGKLAKSHGAARAALVDGDAARLCGALACCVGLLDRPEPCKPQDLLPGFDWQKVSTVDRVVRWEGDRLVMDQASGVG